ncbi:histone-like nucleoid-structuring protein Lsr2 [Rhodococcus qingshengii]|uniref:histone-like nucleoid-structuring protein Lsr2 n=2 Tax=Rhodococcus TaxID=1827 RepID=UPI0033CA1FCC
MVKTSWANSPEEPPRTSMVPPSSGSMVRNRASMRFDGPRARLRSCRPTAGGNVGHACLLLVLGGGYLIDLRPTNVDKFNAAFEPFVKVAEKVGKARGGSKADVTAKDTGSGRSKEQLQAVRDWAVKNGYDVAPRGRVKAEILDAFDAAH